MGTIKSKKQKAKSKKQNAKGHVQNMQRTELYKNNRW